MTAQELTNVDGENSGSQGGDTGRRPDSLEVQIEETIATGGSTITMARLDATVDEPEPAIRDALDGLQADGVVAVHTGYRTVRVQLAEGC